tara:strand:+ start:1288 stop:1767 length:480 start_codon:yes stop_codon:yes gene_type:complete
MDFNIFVSYSTHDLEKVELLRAQLEDTPIKVFIAEHSVTPSQNLRETISIAIEESDLFVVLWSKNAQDSEWVSQEIGQANALKKTILPLVLSEGMSLPGFINDLKYIDVHKNVEHALAKSREVIVHLYNEKAEKHNKQKNSEIIAMMAIGAFLLWAISE